MSQKIYKTISLASPTEVYNFIESKRRDHESHGQAVDRVAEELGVSRRTMFNYQKDGINMVVTGSAAIILEKMDNL